LEINRPAIRCFLPFDAFSHITKSSPPRALSSRFGHFSASTYPSPLQATFLYLRVGVHLTSPFRSPPGGFISSACPALSALSLSLFRSANFSSPQLCIFGVTLFFFPGREIGGRTAREEVSFFSSVLPDFSFCSFCVLPDFHLPFHETPLPLSSDVPLTGSSFEGSIRQCDRLDLFPAPNTRSLLSIWKISTPVCLPGDERCARWIKATHRLRACEFHFFLFLYTSPLLQSHYRDSNFGVRVRFGVSPDFPIDPLPLGTARSFLSPFSLCPAFF